MEKQRNPMGPRTWRDILLQQQRYIRGGASLSVTPFPSLSSPLMFEWKLTVQVTPSLAHPAAEDAPMPTLESLALQRTAASPLHSATPETAIPQPSSNTTTAEPGFEETEEEAGQEGAFNEETGEINWDCSCLGGMAHGPCGEEFRAAFSCFVYSKEEPKGMECIDRFKWVFLPYCVRPVQRVGGKRTEETKAIKERIERTTYNIMLT